MIVCIRTESKEAEIQLRQAGQTIASETWEAHRTLSDTILQKIENLLSSRDGTWQDVTGIVIFKGPGSFTGLRIGATVANTLSDSLQIPIVGETNDSWAENGEARLREGENDELVLPEYGAEANITKPKNKVEFTTSTIVLVDAPVDDSLVWYKDIVYLHRDFTGEIVIQVQSTKYSNLLRTSRS